jgi:hypothetical protein
MSIRQVGISNYFSGLAALADAPGGGEIAICFAAPFVSRLTAPACPRRWCESKLDGFKPSSFLLNDVIKALKN